MEIKNNPNPLSLNAAPDLMVQVENRKAANKEISERMQQAMNRLNEDINFILMLISSRGSIGPSRKKGNILDTES